MPWHGWWCRKVGYAQGSAGTRDESFGKWYKGPPYGDDPKDQDQINHGIIYTKP